jgi:hypothetical protein
VGQLDRARRKFYQALIQHPVPVDIRALQALKNSALALDLYAWCTYRAFAAQTKKKSQRVPWRSLMIQLGCDYDDVQNFRRKALEALRKIQLVYPNLQLDIVEGGLEIKPCPPAVLPF